MSDSVPLHERFYDAAPDLDGFTAREAYEAGVNKVLAAVVPVGWRWREPRPSPMWCFADERPVWVPADLPGIVFTFSTPDNGSYRAQPTTEDETC